MSLSKSRSAHFSSLLLPEDLWPFFENELEEALPEEAFVFFLLDEVGSSVSPRLGLTDEGFDGFEAEAEVEAEEAPSFVA